MSIKIFGAPVRSMLVVSMLAGAFASGGAWAASEDVIVKFIGRYMPLSCSVQTGSETITVELPTVSTQSLSSVGDVGGSTRFEIPIDCEGSAGTVRAYFLAEGTSDAEGRLIPQAPDSGTSAQGVRIELLNESGSVIRVGDKSTVTPVAFDGGADPVNLVYYARYYGTGGATAGVVNTYVNYVLDIP